MDQAPTGKIYKGNGIKLDAKVESVQSLIELSKSMKGSVKFNFINKYGNILDLLHVSLQNDALVELGQYWDASLRCFTFSGFQMTPTIEEYGEILRMPIQKDSQVYHYPGHLPTEGAIAKLLGVRKEEVKLVCPGKVEGISRTFLEGHLRNLAKAQNWNIFPRVFALIIYGTIIFPSSVGLIDLGAISVFHMVEHHRINPVPAILADTYMSLSHCHMEKNGKIKCCLQLLYIWMLSHIHADKVAGRQRYDKHSNPLTSFEHILKIEKMNKNDWKKTFSELAEDSVRWKIQWWEDEKMIYSCGDFSNVPLMGPRGCINYNPILALRQLAFRQREPAKKEVEAIHFLYEQKEMNALSLKIKKAWTKIMYKGMAELGKREVGRTPGYKDWLMERIQGANPIFGPPEPLLRNDVQVNRELAKHLEKRAKGLLKKKLQDNDPLKELQHEVDTFTQLLENKMNELVAGKGNVVETIQNLVNELNQEREVLANWKVLHHMQTNETKEWAKRCGDQINFANAKIPEFVGTFKRAKGMIIPQNPVNPPPEFTDFFNLCNQIIDELKKLTKF